MAVQLIIHPSDKFRLGDFLLSSFASKKWTHFRAAVAFVKQSGTKHIFTSLDDFIKNGGKSTITAGIDVGGTTVEGLKQLLAAKSDVFVFHNANSSTFHPKVYLFKNATYAELVVGSGNLTEGGLFINYEASMHIALDLGDKRDAEILKKIEATLDEWSHPKDGLCYKLTEDLIKRLVEEGKLPDEVTARAERKSAVAEKQLKVVTSIFKGFTVPAAPKASIPEPEFAPPSPAVDAAVLEDSMEAEALTVTVPAPVTAQNGKHKIFLMTLQKTDVGTGQTTKGAQRRSPEIFIPLVCRDDDPDFWGWPDLFVEDGGWAGEKDHQGMGKMDRTNVNIRLGAQIFPVAMWYYPPKKEFRLRSEHMRSAGNVGDILYLERSDGKTGFSYYAEIIPQGTAKYDEYITLCTKGVRNSQKQWNYLD